jgi:lysyl-tRNA synthetase class 2
MSELDESDLVRQRREKLSRLRHRGADPYRFTQYDRTHLSQEIRDAFDSLEGETVRVAGDTERQLSPICKMDPVPSSSSSA